MTEIFSDTSCRQLLQMIIAIFFFHISEYVLVVAIHGKGNVTLKSLLISPNYLLAMTFSFIEYIAEIYFFPGLKELWWISNIGLGMVVVGETIRKLAIITAGQAFTHLIRTHHVEDHILVTHGVYQFIRHPSYTGFFIWSVGTQALEGQFVQWLLELWLSVGAVVEQLMLISGAVVLVLLQLTIFWQVSVRQWQQVGQED